MAAAAAIGFNVHAHAQTVTWVNNADGQWHVATNWSSNPLLPGIDNDVMIDQPADILVTLSSGTHSIRSLTSNNRLLISAGSLTIAQNSQMSVFTLSGGALTPEAGVDIGGAFSWTNGDINRGSAMPGVVTANGGLTLSTTSTRRLGVTLNLPAGQTATSTDGGTFNMTDRATINNHGTFNAQSDRNFTRTSTDSLVGADPVFNNFGAFNKTAGTGTATFSGVVFNNTGTVSVTSGTLQLGLGGNSSGSFNAGFGANLTFSGGAHNLAAASSISGAGTAIFSGGTVNIAGNHTIANTTVSGATANFSGVIGPTALTVSSGTATFSSNAITPSTLSLTGGTINVGVDITVAGTFAWSNGDLDRFGNLREVTANGGLTLSTTATRRLGVTLNLPAGQTVTSADGGTFNMTDRATINNHGTFNAQSDRNFTRTTFDPLVGADPVFNNTGTFNKSAGTGTANFSGVIFNNTGAVNVTLGTLQFSLGGDSTGSFNAGFGANLNFSGGTHNLAAASSISGAGTAIFSGGIVNIAGNHTISNTTVSGATANFSGAIGPTALTVSSGTATFSSNAITPSTLSLTGGTINVGADISVVGPFSWSSGNVDRFGDLRAVNANGGLILSTTATRRLGVTLNLPAGQTVTSADGGTFNMTDRATMNNHGTFNAQSDRNFTRTTFDPLVGADPVFNNFGTFNKSAGTGTANFSGVIFNNTGTVNATSGTLQFAFGGNSTGSFNAGFGANLNFSGGIHNLAAASGITGAGTAIFSGGTVNIAGNHTISNTTVSGAAANFSGAIGPTALTVSSGTATFSSNAIMPPSLSLTGGTINVGANITVVGAFNWTNGDLDRFGNVREVTANGGLTLSTTATRRLGVTLNLPAGQTVTSADGGTLNMTDRATINNHGTFNALSDRNFTRTTVDPLVGADPVFNNFGTFNKSAGTGTATFSGVVFNNSGTVSLTSGTLSFTQEVNSTGTISIGPGTTMTSSADFSQSAGSIGGAGTLNNTAGTMTIAGAQNWAAGAVMNLTGGALNLNSDAGAGGENLIVNITGANANFGSTQRLGGLSISSARTVTLSPGGDKVLKTSALTLLGTARLNLTDNHLIVQGGDLQTIHNLVRTARGTTGNWAGNGITSTAAAVDSQFTLGVGDNAVLGKTTFAGLPVTSNSILVMYTYGGDANLDGQVNISDLSILAGNWQQTDRFYFHGDFNYDGVVNITDLSILAGNWQKGAGGAGMSFEEALAMFDVFDGVVVPEPATISLLGFAGLLALRRKR